MIRRASIALAVPLLLAVAGCGGGSAKTVPNLAGERLDVAENTLDDAGFEYEAVGGGDFGIVVRSNWTVCSQRPRPGVRARKVKLYVDRSCASARPAVPAVVGESLEDAEETLQDAGVGYAVVGGGEKGVLVEHLWTVCEQDPEAGSSARTVELYVDREC